MDSSLRDSLANPANEHSKFVAIYLFWIASAFATPRNDKSSVDCFVRIYDSSRNDKKVIDCFDSDKCPNFTMTAWWDSKRL